MSKLGDSFGQWKKRLSDKLSGFFHSNDEIELDSSERLNLNNTMEKRNTTVLLGIVIVAALVVLSYMGYKNKAHASHQSVENTQELGEVLTSEFSAKDASSAERMNASTLIDVNQQLEKFKAKVAELQESVNKSRDDNMKMSENVDRLKNTVRSLDGQLKVAKDMASQATVKTSASSSSSAHSTGTNERDPSFGQGVGGDFRNNIKGGNFIAQNNPNADYINGDDRHVSESNLDIDSLGQSTTANTNSGSGFGQNTSALGGIDSFTISQPEQPKAECTYKTCVSSGSYVTAVITGGAEANAGVGGESSTATVLMRTINSGFLPDGHHSKLKNCSITGSAYGDISSQRGVIRTDRMSCVRKDGTIMDIPVEASVFSLGKMGVRGNVIMRNSKIVRALGISSVFAGIGEGFSSNSSTTTTSPLGSTAAITNTGTNVLGSTSNNGASKLADYYAKLVEKYHPDIDIHSGAVVNVVFLKGFPLDKDQQDSYSQQVDQKRSDETNDKGNGLISQLTSVPSAAGNAVQAITKSQLAGIK